MTIKDKGKGASSYGSEKYSVGDRISKLRSFVQKNDISACVKERERERDTRMGGEE